ncbi:DUF4179 domain-containing protein [Saccharibacillus sp. JS10]|uniref:DUF4179 domain-containing protein n=1 Tax=Saccharibacillus sp. JS10 TaxID=2950552 RepID=UPI00210E29A5|nr:DUF4179 domain-containing protein [Saccharibacillus sp. JS10]MCQ4085434.1 DUF4179 domain-containing protein [Saccharibacillus sp. JS10]
MNPSNNHPLELHLKKAGENTPPISPFVRSRLDDTYASLPEQTVAATPVSARPRFAMKRHMNRLMWTAASVIVISSGVFASGFASPAMADTIREIPLIGSLFTKIKGDEGLRTAGERQQGLMVHATAAVGNTKMNIKETIFDGSRIAVALDLTLPGVSNTSDFEGQVENITLEIGGKKLDGFFYEKPIDQGNGTYTLLANRPLDAKEADALGLDFEARLNISIQNQTQPLQATVPFERIVTGYEFKLTPGPTVSDQKYTLNIDRLNVTASTVQLNTTLELNANQMSAEEQQKALLPSGYELVDDRGHALDVIGGQATQEGNKMVGMSNYGADLAKTKFITIKPYLLKNDNKQYLKNLELQIDLKAKK